MNIAKNVVERAEDTIVQRELAAPDTPVLLMVSGGSDSTALAYIACELRERGVVGPVGIVHVNHNLRGEASDGIYLLAMRVGSVAAYSSRRYCPSSARCPRAG